MARRILVTGATGFVGSVLLPQLIAKWGNEAISTFILPDDPIPPSWENQRVTIFHGNICDRQAVLQACQGHSHIVHLAGLISYWKKDRDTLMKVNRDGVQNMVDAALANNVERLIHISTVGAIGFDKKGNLADENTPFNWPPYFHYMTSKYAGQQIVERAVQEKKLRAIVLNPASIMGPGDPNLNTPHNQLYHRIYNQFLFGSFSGGLAVVDVRDLAALIIKTLDNGKIGERYLVVGANISYRNVIKTIGRFAARKTWPFPVPACILTAMGGGLETISLITKKRPLLTYSYGRISGWRTYYSNEKSRKELSHSYIDFNKTIQDTCTYFEQTFK